MAKHFSKPHESPFLSFIGSETLDQAADGMYDRGLPASPEVIECHPK
jgi:hypothetical protein